MKLFVVSLVFVGAIIALVVVAMTSSIPVLGLGALQGGEYVAGEKVQVEGGQIVHIESRMPLRFEVGRKKDSNWRMLVESPRSPPENFKVGIPVSLRGTYDEATNTFQAYHITTQCPSRYEAAEAYKNEEKATEKEPSTQAPGLAPE